MNNFEKENYEAFETAVEDVAKKTGNFMKKAFQDMAENAKAQHEVDKANFEAIKAESKANFEENRFHNTFAKAKEDAKKSWDDAHLSPSERAQKALNERDEQLAAAKERIAQAQARIETAKK